MANHDPDLSLIFQALADPTRRAMLAALGKGAVPVSDLARPTGLALPTVLRHIGVLEAAGLVASEKQGRVRTCRLCPQVLDHAAHWLQDQRAVWEARADRLEAYVMQLMAEGEDHAP